jgi:hypothetical protein
MGLMAKGGELRETVPTDEWNAWLAEHNIELQASAMEYDLGMEHLAYIRHFEDGNTGSVGWDPSPPGPEWHMLSIHDTEDGPVVVWYRAIPDVSEKA